MKNRPKSIAIPSVVLYKGVFGAEAGEADAVVGRRRRVGVEDLATGRAGRD